MSADLAMGGYGAFVWSAFGLTLAVLAICVWQARAAQSRTRNEIQSRLRAMDTSE